MPSLSATRPPARFDLSVYPKLKKLHQRMKGDPKLALYFASDAYKSYAVNNPVSDTTDVILCTLYYYQPKR